MRGVGNTGRTLPVYTYDKIFVFCVSPVRFQLNSNKPSQASCLAIGLSRIRLVGEGAYEQQAT